MLTRPAVLLSMTLPALLLLAGPAPPPASPPPAPKSLILISLDTTRADHLHCYGYPLRTSPALDRLASEGIVFEKAFTQAVNTGPSHASLLTGLAPIAHGSRINGVPLNPEFVTLPILLAKSGYRTAAFVSGYTLLASQTGFNRGFEIYDDKFAGQDRRASETVDRAVAWLKTLPKDSSYFLFVHLFDPHGKYDPPEGFAEKFRVGKYEPISDPELIPDYQRLETPGGGFSKDPLDYVSRYDGEIAYADSQIARLLAEAGDKPTVVFTADHGETLVDRDYYFSHGSRMNEEALRVPLILRVPDRGLRGKRVTGMAQLVDVLPTVLTLLGQPLPPRLAGRNLLPYARLGAIPPGGVVLSEGHAAPMTVGGHHLVFPPRGLIFSARGDRFKLIGYPTTSGRIFELFDLEKDPGERTGVLGEEAARASPVYSALDLYLATGRAPEPPELDDETKKKLRSLGYVN